MSDALTEEVLLRRFRHLERLPGFLDVDAFRLFCILGGLNSEISAHVVEIGVFCGRSLTGLALAFPEARVVGVDPMFDDFDNEYALEGEGAFLAEVANGATPDDRLKTLRRVLHDLESDGEDGLVNRVSVSRVTQTTFLAELEGPATNQVVHLDGEHTYAAVEEALDHLPALLVGGGWLIVDDFSNPGFPEIAEAIHRHASFRADLSPAVFGFNKGIFLFRADAERRRASLERIEREWKSLDYVVRRLGDGALVIHAAQPTERGMRGGSLLHRLRGLATRIT